MAAVTQALKRVATIKKSDLPPILKTSTGNLYEVLSRTPSGGVGSEVHQTRWSQKQIPDSYWVITRSKFKCEGMHGKAWGKLYWRGALITPKEELVRGALKYSWKVGRSKASQNTPSTEKPPLESTTN